MPYDDEEYFTVERGNMNRHSTCMNEDDYDYAIELKMDDEYRQAADALPSIAELDDVDDDDLLIMLDEKRQSISDSLSSASVSPSGIVKYIRDSFSLSPSVSTSNRRSDLRDSCVINVVPSPLRALKGVDIELGGISDGRSPSKLIPKSSTSLTALSPKRKTPLFYETSLSPSAENVPKISELDVERWSLSSIWAAGKEATRPISITLQKVAASARALTSKEPLNPVTALFEPVTLMSKSLLVISSKGKMDIKECKQSQEPDQVASNGKDFSVPKIRDLLLFIVP